MSIELTSSLVHIPRDEEKYESPIQTNLDFLSFKESLEIQAKEELYKSILMLSLKMDLIDWKKEGFSGDKDSGQIKKVISKEIALDDFCTENILKLESILNLILQPADIEKLREMLNARTNIYDKNEEYSISEVKQKLAELHPDTRQKDVTQDYFHEEYQKLLNRLQNLKKGRKGRPIKVKELDKRELNLEVIDQTQFLTNGVKSSEAKSFFDSQERINPVYKFLYTKIKNEIPTFKKINQNNEYLQQNIYEEFSGSIVEAKKREVFQDNYQRRFQNDINSKRKLILDTSLANIINKIKSINANFSDIKELSLLKTDGSLYGTNLVYQKTRLEVESGLQAMQYMEPDIKLKIVNFEDQINNLKQKFEELEKIGFLEYLRSYSDIDQEIKWVINNTSDNLQEIYHKIRGSLANFSNDSYESMALKWAYKKKQIKIINRQIKEFRKKLEPSSMQNPYIAKIIPSSKTVDLLKNQLSGLEPIVKEKRQEREEIYQQLKQKFDEAYTNFRKEFNEFYIQLILPKQQKLDELEKIKDELIVEGAKTRQSSFNGVTKIDLELVRLASSFYKYMEIVMKVLNLSDSTNHVFPFPLQYTTWKNYSELYALIKDKSSKI